MDQCRQHTQDPEIQVLQIVSPNDPRKNGEEPAVFFKGLEPAQSNSQHAANLSFSAMNRRRIRSSTGKDIGNGNGLAGRGSGKLAAMLDLDKYKHVVASDADQPPSSTEPPKDSYWTRFSQGITCCCFPFLLSMCGMKGYYVQQAWREKVFMTVMMLRDEA
jgi:hypothetical protein